MASARPGVIDVCLGTMALAHGKQAGPETTRRHTRSTCASRSPHKPASTDLTAPADHDFGPGGYKRLGGSVIGWSPDLLVGMISAVATDRGAGLPRDRGGGYAAPTLGEGNGRATRSGPLGRNEQWSIGMPSKGKGSDVRHPRIVGYLESLNAEEAAVHPPIILEQDGVCMRYWLEGGRVRSCEVGGPAASEDPSGLVSVLERARAEFGALLPRAAKDLDGEVPDLDAIERAVRDSSHGSGAAALKALLESLDARLPVPDCPQCGARMERHRRAAKRFATRLGEVEVVRSHCRCRDCGGGHHPLDRVLGIEGKQTLGK